MTTQPESLGGDILAAVKRLNARGDFLLLAYAVMFAPLFLSNNYGLAPKLFVLPIIAAAFFVGGIQLRSRPPQFFLSGSFATTVTFSVIFVAILIYLLAVTSWTALQPGIANRLADEQWLLAGQILLFVLITSHAVARIDRFLVRLLTLVVPIVAVSALMNVWVFLTTTPIETLARSRLTNWLGMPGYTNSTNISVTYALFFVAALAVILRPGRDILLRWWLALPAAILLVSAPLTQARAALIGLLLGSAIVILLSAGRQFWIRQGWKFGVAILVAAGLIASSATVRSIVAERGESLRPEIWKIYASKALANPLRGTGGLANIDIVLSSGAIIDQPHNLILSSQVRGGLFAMIAMIVILLGSLYWASRYWLLTRSVIPLGMIATVAATGLFDYNLLITAPTWPWVTFWLPFAVCSGAEMAVRNAAAEPRASQTLRV